MGGSFARAVAVFVVVLGVAAQARASAGRLIVLDRSATAGKVHVSYKAPAPAFALPIGAGPADVAAEITVRIDDESAVFSVPAGAYADGSGWKSNDDNRALFLNRGAPDGPTGARKAIVRGAGSVGLVAKSLGDGPVGMNVIGPPAIAVDVQYAVTSGGSTGRVCTHFAPGDCRHQPLDDGGAAKLVCRDGLSDPDCVAFGGTPSGFTCTEILGFSQTLMWHETPEFESEIDDARYQLRFRSGGDLEVWADPNADAWSAPVRTDCLGSGNVVLCTPCAQGSNAPDRVILTITMKQYIDDVQVWAQNIRAAVAQIRRQHPQARQIVLQPVVGGPGDRVCPFPGQPQGVRASFNNPYVDDAVAIVVRDAPDLIAGISPEVQSCSAYEDDVGHITEAGRGPVGRAIGQYYRARP